MLSIDSELCNYAYIKASQINFKLNISVQKGQNEREKKERYFFSDSFETSHYSILNTNKKLNGRS